MEENRICADCVSDAYLKAEIDLDGLHATCSYCGAGRSTIGIDDLSEKVDVVIENFYEVSIPTLAAEEYGIDPDGYPLEDILDQIVGTPERARDDLVESLKEAWFDYSSHEHQYGEDPWFTERSRLADPLSAAWDRMQKSLYDSARLVNPTVVELLEQVFGPVTDDRTHQGDSVITRLASDQPDLVLYRARVFQNFHTLEEALSHPERFLGPPVSIRAPVGRMNASGISVFYGAMEAKTSINEVRPPVGSYVAVARFRVLRNLQVLDLHALNNLALEPDASVFDPNTVSKVGRRDFLKAMADRLAAPVMPESQDRDYLITQAVADFLSTHPKLQLDGIVYPSTQSKKKTCVGLNVVLFSKAASVKGATEGGAMVAEAQLFEHDEDQSYFHPEIVSYPDEVTERMAVAAYFRPSETKKPSLELDRGSIEIFKIEGVEYESTNSKVTHRLGKRPARAKWPG